MSLGNYQDWLANGNVNGNAITSGQPYITTSGTTNIFYAGGPLPVQSPEPVAPESAMDWLRGEVDEMCAAGRSAL